MVQQCITGEDKPNEIIFHVPIGSAKKLDITNFHPYAPAIKYVQHDNNDCCFSSLESDIFDAREHFQNSPLPSELNNIYYVNHLFKWIRSIFPIKL